MPMPVDRVSGSVNQRVLNGTHSVTPEHACSPAINQHLEVIESHEFPGAHGTRSKADTADPIEVALGFLFLAHTAHVLLVLPTLVTTVVVDGRVRSEFDAGLRGVLLGFAKSLGPEVLVDAYDCSKSAECGENVPHCIVRAGRRDVPLNGVF